MLRNNGVPSVDDNTWSQRHQVRVVEELKDHDDKSDKFILMDSSSDGTYESNESDLGPHSSSTSSEHQKESGSDVSSQENTRKRRNSFCNSEIEKIAFDTLSERCNRSEEEEREDERFNECISEKNGSILQPQVKWLLMSDHDDDKQSQQSGVSI